MPHTVPVAGLAGLRSANRSLLVQALRREGESSRADLSRITGLSVTTISSLVAELSDSGVISETTRDDRSAGRSGRPGRLLRLAPTNDLVAGIDLAGPTIQLAVADLSGRISAESSAPADVGGGGQATLIRAAALLDAVVEASSLDRQALRGVVLGIPGIVDPTNGLVVASGRMGAWQGLNPAAWFSQQTGISTQSENDADLAALGECALGAARGFTDVVFVKVSAGIGAGLILGGHLYRGLHGAAGEIGHVQVKDDGEVCLCGNRGCLETIASVNSVLRDLSAVHPSAVTAQDLADLIGSGDRAAVRVVTDAGLAIGQKVADLCNTLAPEAVVLGGEMTWSPGPFADAVSVSIDRYTRPYIGGRIKVLTTSLGSRAGVLGALRAAAASVETRPT